MSVWATFLLVIAIWQNSVILLLLFLIMLPSELPKIPRPYLWEGLLFCGNFFFITPSLGWLSFPDLLPLFSSLSFVLLHFKEIGLSFWVSGVFCQHSKVVFFFFLFCFVLFVCLFFVEVASHEDDLLMYLWGRKWSPHPIPLPSWDSPLFVFLMLSYMRSLYMLDINPLTLILFEIIYSHSVNCLHFVNGFLYCVKGFKFN